ncbi:MAG: monovalent cation/H+ antiporter subunit A, partial [Rhodanobacter sp.]
MPDNALPSAIICLPFVASVVVLLLRGRGRGHNLAAWLMTATALLGLLLCLWLYPAIAAGHVLRQVIPWVPGLRLDLVFRVDGFSWLFMLLICGIGTLVGLYARYYMSPDDPLARFFALLLAFMGS